MEIQEIKSVLEALLFSADKPLSLAQIGKALDGVERKSLHQLLDELRSEYDAEGRGFRLGEIAEGWQMSTRPHHGAFIRKLNRAKGAGRLSKPALESLAIIAYKQPITKAEIEGIRGVNSDGVLYSLLERRLVRTVGRKDVAGRPLLYGTTREFLQTFGLKDLSELPKLAELKDLLKQDEANAELWSINEQGELIPKSAEEFLKGQEAAAAQPGEEAAAQAPPPGGEGPEGEEEEEGEDDEDEDDDEDDDETDE